MDRIKRKYTDELFTLLIEYNISKELLDATPSKNEKGYKTFKISIKNSPFYFLLVNSPDDFEEFTCSYILFKAKYPLHEVRDKWRLFLDIKPYFLKWIREVKDYFDELTRVDLWEQLKSSSTINLEEINFDDRTNFNGSEIQQIKLAIDDLKVQIAKEFNLQGQQFDLMNEKLDYLCEASKRLNKFDWKSLFINIMFTTAIDLSLDSTKIQLLFLLFKKVITVTTQFLIK